MSDQHCAEETLHERSLIEAARRAAAQLRGSAGSPSGAPFELGGQVIDGYDLLHEIHRGGQGIVYRALQRSTCRHVAIKVMLHGPLASDSARVRFNREVRVVAALRHPNIVVIHDSGVVHDCPYFVMDFIPGRSIVEHCRNEELPVARAVKVIRQVLDAASFAHRRGVIHRDLKPSNILVSDEGIAYVLDFGLARTAGDLLEPHLAATISQPGDMLGTVNYMAPEQTLGRPEMIRPWTDVHALGVIMYEVLSGLHPFLVAGDISGTIQKIREFGPPNLAGSRPGIDAELGAVLIKALQKEPTARYSSATEMLQDVDRWLELNREHEARPLVASRAPSPQRRSLAAVSAVGILAAVALIGAGAYLRPGSRPQPSSTKSGAQVQSVTEFRQSPEMPPSGRPSSSGLLGRLRQDLPIRSLKVEPATSAGRIRITGWLLNRAELDVLYFRIREVRGSVEVEAQVNPEQVRVLVAGALRGLAGQDLKVRLEGKRGVEHLTVEMVRTDNQPGVEALARSFVFDASAVTFRAYHRADAPVLITETHTRPAPEDRH